MSGESEARRCYLNTPETGWRWPGTMGPPHITHPDDGPSESTRHVGGGRVPCSSQALQATGGVAGLESAHLCPSERERRGTALSTTSPGSLSRGTLKSAETLPTVCLHSVTHKPSTEPPLTSEDCPVVVVSLRSLANSSGPQSQALLQSGGQHASVCTANSPADTLVKSLLSSSLGCEFQHLQSWFSSGRLLVSAALGYVCWAKVFLLPIPMSYLQEVFPKALDCDMEGPSVKSALCLFLQGHLQRHVKN